MRWLSIALMFISALSGTVFISCDDNTSGLTGGDYTELDGDTDINLPDGDIDTAESADNSADIDMENGDIESKLDPDSEWGNCEQICPPCTRQLPDCSCIHDTQYECSEEQECEIGKNCSDICICEESADGDGDADGDVDSDSGADSDMDMEWAACEQECQYCTEQLPDCSCIHDELKECSSKRECVAGYECSLYEICTCRAVEIADGDAEECNPVIFDMDMLRNQDDLECSFTNQRTEMKDGVMLYVWDVSYISYESIGCELKPILIRGFAARPMTLASNAPAVIHAHGLGGCADPDNAKGPAALLGMLVLAYTGPGGNGGTTQPDCAVSEGLPASYASGYRMFDTIPDPRASWFWGHAVAAMRGLTCLETRPETDSSRMGITGFSAGGVVTLISAAVDSRVKAAVSLSASGAWDVATESPDAWQHNLLTLAGLNTASAQWLTLSDTIVPDVLLSGTSAKILMANGSTDEFFPLTAHMATYNQIPGSDKRLAIAANFDHGCFGLTGVENAEDIEERAQKASSGNQRAWLRHHFATDDDYEYYPLTPQVTANPLSGGIYATAIVDGGGSKLDIERVKFWMSNDNAFLFASVEMEYNDDLHVWAAPVAAPLQENSVYFVEVEYKTKALILPERFILTSEPHVPAGFVPHIRGMDDCL